MTTRRGFYIAAAFMVSFGLWAALYLAGCFALMFAGRIVGGLF